MTPEESEVARLVNEHYQKVQEAWNTPIDQRIEFNLIHPNAQVPTKGSPDAAGWDLYYTGEDNRVVELTNKAPNNSYLFSTGLQVKVPKGYYGRIAPRSGLGIRGIDVHGGVIDSDYRGEIKVCLVNHGWHTVNIEEGDRIAQLIIERIFVGPMNFHPYKPGVSWEKETSRGDKGFGSTGR